MLLNLGASGVRDDAGRIRVALGIAAACLGGVMFFGEPCNVWLVLGMLMTIVGIMLIGPPSDTGPREMAVRGPA